MLFGIGRLSLPNVTALAIDLAPLASGLGQPIAGILGYDVFERFVVEIDYGDGMVAFHDAARYAPPRTSDVVPIEIADQTPFVRSELLRPSQSATARLELDTGQTGALTLLRPFVDANHLLAPGQPEVRITTGALLPGAVATVVTRTAGIRIGRTTIGHVVTNIAPDAEAACLSGDTAGILGGGLLKRFGVTLDYSRRQLILEPRDDGRPAEPTEFDMSGISLAAQGPAYREYRVRLVLDGSPGAEAGVMAGDLLAAIGGRPAEDLTLSEIREWLRRDAQEYALELRRGGAVVRTTLRTRRML